jgi:hypothetical protein
VIRAVWLAFWGELNTPSSFRADPQGALVNQVGHVALGAFLSSTLALAYCAVAGEMPFRWPVWAAITLGYLLTVEWFVQRWSGPDSLIDGGFVSLGAAAPLAALREVAFLPSVKLEPQPVQGLAVLAMIVVALAAYVLPRARQKLREDRGAGQ